MMSRKKALLWAAALTTQVVCDGMVQEEMAMGIKDSDAKRVVIRATGSLLAIPLALYLAAGNVRDAFRR